MLTLTAYHCGAKPWSEATKVLMLLGMRDCTSASVASPSVFASTDSSYFVLGFSANAMNFYIFVVYLYSTFVHANLNWRFPFVEKLLVTPRFHHWHHGIEKEAIRRGAEIQAAEVDLRELLAAVELPVAGAGERLQPADLRTGLLRLGGVASRQETHLLRNFRKYARSEAAPGDSAEVCKCAHGRIPRDWLRRARARPNAAD